MIPLLTSTSLRLAAMNGRYNIGGIEYNNILLRSTPMRISKLQSRFMINELGLDNTLLKSVVFRRVPPGSLLNMSNRIIRK